jgi:Tfp pilus assembly protein PilX
MRIRHGERGSAMLVTMIIISALLAGAAVLVSIQLSSTKATELERNGLASLYCAEAGLRAAEPTVSTNYQTLVAHLCYAGNAATTDCTGNTTGLDNTVFSHDIDGDGVDDFRITLKDDDDESTTNDPSTDINNKIFIVSTCIKYSDAPKQVMELIEYTSQAQCDPRQKGGCNNRGNNNGASGGGV